MSAPTIAVAALTAAAPGSIGVPLGPGAGAAVGALCGLGLTLVAVHLAARRPRLGDRVAPYLRAPVAESGAGPDVGHRTPFTTVERLLTPVMADAVRWVERLGSPTAQLQRRLVRAGGEVSVERFRVEQVVAAVLGTACGLALALLLLAGRGLPLPLALLLVVTGALAGLVLRDQALTRRIQTREREILLELPSLAELLALGVGAGEGVRASLDRVSTLSTGPLSEEFRGLVAATHAGLPLAEALERLADRTGVAELTRFAEAIAVAVERGTPLAEVLRAQAQDVREAGRRALMEAGGRKEVAMMVPVVFLILPVTVVFAVFPGLWALRLDL
ncbi:type II secretion system F family protein [Actinotalea sp.]|uniref:type II secretion system F family protein n=1 Tax=Actinotalea sp. TaxID=1872145 RepID=UPI00356AB622